MKRGNAGNKTRKILSNIKNSVVNKNQLKSLKNNINLNTNKLEEINIEKTNIKKCNKFN